MHIERISDLRALVAVVERGGITAAARHLGRSIQSISRSLATVEQSIGVELVRRTTRSSRPTEAGLQLCLRIASALAEMDSAALDAAEGRIKALGLLRVSASTRFGAAFVAPAIASFLADHSGVEVELDLSDRFVDLVNEGYDVAVRIGQMPDSSLKARRVASLRRITFAAPSYIARAGAPLHPEDLADHQCIVRTASRDGALWPFMVDGAVETFPASGRFKTSSAEAANQAAILGLGVGTAPFWQVRDFIESGALQLLLTAFEPPEIAVHLVWPASRQPPAKTRLFVERLAEQLKRERL